MEKNRRAFLVRLVTFPLAAAFLGRFLAACGSETVSGCAAGVTVFASGTHTHSITITREDIVAGAQKSYTTTVGTGNGHTHTVVVTAAQMAALAANSDVTLTSSVDDTHDHPLTITC